MARADLPASEMAGAGIGGGALGGSVAMARRFFFVYAYLWTCFDYFCREWLHSVCMRRSRLCGCVRFWKYFAASLGVFGFWTIGLCVYVFIRHVCDRVTC